jgi:hypothetical protein
MVERTTEGGFAIMRMGTRMYGRVNSSFKAA